MENGNGGLRIIFETMWRFFVEFSNAQFCVRALSCLNRVLQHGLQYDINFIFILHGYYTEEFNTPYTHQSHPIVPEHHDYTVDFHPPAPKQLKTTKMIAL